MGDKTEKRSSLRSTIPQPVSMELISMVQNKSRTNHIDGMCVDISSMGMCLNTDCFIPNGNLQKLHYSLIDMKVTLSHLDRDVYTCKAINRYSTLGLLTYNYN